MWNLFSCPEAGSRCSSSLVTLDPPETLTSLFVSVSMWSPSLWKMSHVLYEEFGCVRT